MIYAKEKEKIQAQVSGRKWKQAHGRMAADDVELTCTDFFVGQSLP